MLHTARRGIPAGGVFLGGGGGGRDVAILKWPRCGGRERPPYRARETAAANRETMIRALSRTRVGADSISARSAAPQTPRADMESAPTVSFPRHPAFPRGRSLPEGA